MTFRGTAWTPSLATRSMLPGVDLIGVPGPFTDSEDSASLTAQTPSGITYIAAPRPGSRPLRIDVHLPGLSSALPLSSGQGLIVVSPSGGTITLPR